MHSESRTLRPCNCCRNQKHCLCCGQMKWFSPIFITAISLVQLLVFVYCWYTVETPVVWPHRSSSSTAALSSLLYNSPLAYRSDRRAQMWRFFTYALLHNSWWHLGFNTLVQLVVGVSLECVHGSLSTGLLYTGAVLAGSLLVSVVVTSHQVAMVGSSAAIYSLAAAYVTYCVQNYRRVRFAFLRLLLIVLAVACDVTMSAIRTPNSSPSSSSFTLPWVSSVSVRVSLWSHLGGALSGTVLGYCLLGSTTTSVEPPATPGTGGDWFTSSLVQRILRCVLLALYMCCHLAAVVYNVLLSWARVV